MRPRPVLLTLHAGAFLFGGPLGVDVADEVAERNGFRAVPVDYPLGDLPAAVATVDELARGFRHRHRVFAYGESAGGTLALLLAQKQLAEASATYSPVVDIGELIEHAPDPRFYRASLRATDLQIEEHSPGNRPAVNPVLALAPAGNRPYLNHSLRRWQDGQPNVTIVDVEGGHLALQTTSEVYRENVERAVGWLADLAGLSR